MSVTTTIAIRGELSGGVEKPIDSFQILATLLTALDGTKWPVVLVAGDNQINLPSNCQGFLMEFPAGSVNAKEFRKTAAVAGYPMSPDKPFLFFCTGAVASIIINSAGGETAQMRFF